MNRVCVTYTMIAVEEHVIQPSLPQPICKSATQFNHFRLANVEIQRRIVRIAMRPIAIITRQYLVVLN